MNSPTPVPAPRAATMKCPNCSAENLSSNNFCNNCGARIMAPQPQFAMPPVQDSSRHRPQLVALLIVGVIVLLITYLALSPSRTPHPITQSNTPAPETAPTPPESAPASAPASAPESQWDYSTEQDNMGRALSFAEVESTNTLEFGFPYGGVQHGRLTIRKKSGHGMEVYVRIEQGQFMCGVEDCTVNVRFDEGPIRHFTAVPPSDNSTTVLFIEDATDFIAALRKAKNVTIEATFYQEGSQGLEFNVEGFKQP